MRTSLSGWAYPRLLCFTTLGQLIPIVLSSAQLSCCWLCGLYYYYYYYYCYYYILELLLLSHTHIHLLPTTNSTYHVPVLTKYIGHNLLSMLPIYTKVSRST